jgi:hypothetical protein
MLALDVIERLKERVDHLQGRVEGAADLIQLRSENRSWQAPLGAHVVADGLTGGVPGTSSSAFTQPFDETVAVVLTFRNFQGQRGLDLYDTVKWAVINALCGWAPTGQDGVETVGVFRLQRGRVIGQDTGTLFYQIDFAIGDQLRIVT